MQLDRKDLKITRLLINELAGCESVLDLGCGQSSMLQYAPGVKRSLGVDYWQPYIDESRKHGIHSDYQQGDITTLTIPDGAYDAVMLIDVLEHVEKDAGYKLLADMKRWARRKVIVCVPNGDMPQEDDPYGEGNEKQKHVARWTPAELERHGFSVCGFGGWKPLRGDGANIIPTRTRAGHYFLSGLSLLSEPIVEIFPSHAFHLFAVNTKSWVVQR